MLCSFLLLILLSGCGIESSVPPTINTSELNEPNRQKASSPPIVEAEVTTPAPTITPTATPQTVPDDYDYTLEFPSDSYPETALHINNAIENGHSDVCTIDREGADENRKKSLAGIDTMTGYDRDEWPMAMCAEGGEGASVAYIDPSDNRGAGSWVGNQLSAYENGEKVLFIVAKPKNLFGKTPSDDLNVDEDLVPTKPTAKPGESTTETIAPPKQTEIYYKNCTEVREAGAAPIMKGDPGYSKKLDRDGDGIGCEVS